MIERRVGTGSAGTGAADLDDVLARLAQATNDLQAFDLHALIRLDRPSQELIAAGHAIEHARRQLASLDVPYIAALEAGGEPARHGATSTAGFLAAQFKIPAGEAKARVLLSQACAPRPGFSGPAQAPQLPALATALAAGQVGTAAAALVRETIQDLPARLDAQDRTHGETALVADAIALDYRGLGRAARHLADRLDPDGTLRDAEHHQATRTATLTVRRDGTGFLQARLPAEVTEKLRCVLEPLAAPRPVDANGPDTRSPGARTADALEAVFDRILAAGDLPASGGIPATVIVHLTAEQVESRAGLAVTGHGTLIPAAQALAMADQGLIYTLITDNRNVPLRLGRTSRCATPGQTIALAARDRGCSFPGCDRPPGWCQRHHVQEWTDNGPTDIDNLTLLCGYHHRNFQQLGWTCTITDGHPWWTPPTWIDPQRTPIRNTCHDV